MPIYFNYACWIDGIRTGRNPFIIFYNYLQLMGFITRVIEMIITVNKVNLEIYIRYFAVEWTRNEDTLERMKYNFNYNPSIRFFCGKILAENRLRDLIRFKYRKRGRFGDRFSLVEGFLATRFFLPPLVLGLVI